MKIDHWQHVALVIRAQIGISEGKFDEDDDTVDHALQEDTINPRQFRNIVLGAKQKPLSFSVIESTHSEDAAFQKLRDRFCKFLAAILPENTLATYKSIFTGDTTVS